MPVVYLSGVDGAGKTTLRTALVRRLRGEGRRVTTVHWPSDSLLGLLPHKSGPAASLLLGLVGYDPTGNRERRDDADPKRGAGPERGPRRAAWLVGLLGKFWLVLANAFYMWAVLAVRSPRTDWVVADRSPVDDLVQLEYLGLPSPLVAWGAARLPTTGVYWLAVPADVAMDRDSGPDGPDHPPPYYRSKVRGYERYAGRDATRRLDGTADPGALADRVLADVRREVGP